jgi:hypothetical protein
MHAKSNDECRVGCSKKIKVLKVVLPGVFLITLVTMKQDKHFFYFKNVVKPCHQANKNMKISKILPIFE